MRAPLPTVRQPITQQRRTPRPCTLRPGARHPVITLLTRAQLPTVLMALALLGTSCGHRERARLHAQAVDDAHVAARDAVHEARALALHAEEEAVRAIVNRRIAALTDVHLAVEAAFDALARHVAPLRSTPADAAEHVTPLIHHARATLTERRQQLAASALDVDAWASQTTSLLDHADAFLETVVRERHRSEHSARYRALIDDYNGWVGAIDALGRLVAAQPDRLLAN